MLPLLLLPLVVQVILVVYEQSRCKGAEVMVQRCWCGCRCRYRYRCRCRCQVVQKDP